MERNLAINEEPKMKTTMITAVGMAAAVTIAVPATVHASREDRQFASPSGNIRCVFDPYTDPSTSAPTALCQIEDITYTAPPGSVRKVGGGPCEPGSDLPRLFQLNQGQPAFLTCVYSALDSGFGPWPALAYGQTRSLGTITCDSEPAGMTCTDTGSGHFFRVSRDSFQLG